MHKRLGLQHGSHRVYKRYDSSVSRTTGPKGKLIREVILERRTDKERIYMATYNKLLENCRKERKDRDWSKISWLRRRGNFWDRGNDSGFPLILIIIGLSLY